VIPDLDLAGAYVVSFMVAVVNVVIFEWLYQARWFRALFWIGGTCFAAGAMEAADATVVVGLLVTATLIYGDSDSARIH